MPSYPELRCKGKRMRKRILAGKTKAVSDWGIVRLVSKMGGHW